jgi:hypothetical protein
MAPVNLIASSDDYLLEEKVRETVTSVCASLGGVEAEILADETTPEELAVELCSPSLFAPQRVLVVPQIGSWVDIAAARKPGRRDKALHAEIDPGPVVQVIDEGLSEDIGLVLVALCRDKPRGALVKAVENAGALQWVPVPPQPKPWEDVILTGEQRSVLSAVLARATPDVRFAPDAERLLFDRLGFAPRLLAQEGRKLAAASADGTVDADLVRALSFPKERSLDVVRDALLARKAVPVLDIVAAAEGGVPVRDRQGRVMNPDRVALALVGQASTVFQQLLYLRLFAAENGIVDQMAPERTSHNYWYPREFKNGLGPHLVELLEADAPSPIRPAGSKTMSLFALGGLFKGAGRYTNDALSTALADLGRVETALRGEMATEALTVWFSKILR